jgi:hypothetical protein
LPFVIDLSPDGSSVLTVELRGIDGKSHRQQSRENQQTAHGTLNN